MMNQFNCIITIQDPLGLHMRPAAEIVKLAATFDAVVMLQKGAKSAQAHSIFDIMTLEALCGDEISLMACGNEAREALGSISLLMKDNFNAQIRRDINVGSPYSIQGAGALEGSGLMLSE
jgi:phosphotransferase system HPr (HPr) family protein